jgi:hypothetical protein
VASFPDTDHPEAGYATPAALVIALTITTIAAGLLARSVSELRAARRDFNELRRQAVLDGGHLLAVAAIVSSQREGPYHWTIASEAGRLDIQAEEEMDKLTLAKAADLPEAVFADLGVADTAALRDRLVAAGPDAVAWDLDTAPRWRVCAPIVASPFGTRSDFLYVAPVEPGAGPLPTSWHIGEVWRVSIATPDGWRDNRIVRFTGDVLRPAATVTRRLYRTDLTGEQQTCEDLINDLASG